LKQQRERSGHIDVHALREIPRNAITAAGLFLGDEQLKVQEDRAPSWRPPSSRLLDVE
jgi:hypothetical protein